MKVLYVSAIALLVSGTTEASELPLKRVVLSTSGLAQFTHQGRGAPGDAIELPVRLDQVDDLLKSLTVFDKANGIGSVSLAGKSPVTELFRDLPFGADALNSMTALLNALVGTEVEIDGEVKARGRIFRVLEEKFEGDKGVTTVRHRLSLMTSTGLVQAILEDVSSLQFVDPQAKAQVERALTGLAQNRAKDRRTVSISLLGEAARDVGFTYVVAAPVWKTAYRLVLPKEGGRARLQGWGVIENLTGSDWKEIELSLISGNPVALKQSLYTAFYVDRPEIPVATASTMVPRRDDSDNSGRAMKAAPVPAPRQAYQALASSPRNNREQQRSAPFYGTVGAVGGGGSADATPFEETVAASILAVESEEAATQVIYRFPAAISLAAGSTMMVPFADREISATRTWLYQPDTNERHPLAAVRLKNDSDSALPGGIITAFDTGGDGTANFAGDAQLPLMPKGGFKFVTFALDSKTDIRRIARPVRMTRLGKAIGGQLTLTIKSRWTVDYEITPSAEEDRDIVIDEARSDGWKIAGDAKGVEETPTRLRLKVSAPKAKTTTASLMREKTELETTTLTGQDPEQLLATISGLENEGQALKDAVAKLSGVVADITRLKDRQALLEQERRKIGSDQDRIRKNLSSVGQGSDLGRRYLDSLRVQEDRLTAMAADDKALETEIAAKRKAAEDIARTLTL